MAPLRKPSASAADGCARLAELWVEGLNAPHDAGCGCGGMAMPALDGGEIELDVLGYLAGKHRDAPELTAFLDTRKSARGAARFEDWLAGLDAADLPNEARARQVADLQIFLESFAARGRPRVGICY